MAGLCRGRCCGSIGAMDAFVAKHRHVIRGVLSCFDRVLFRGYVPLMSGFAMAEFLKLKQVQSRTLGHEGASSAQAGPLGACSRS